MRWPLTYVNVYIDLRMGLDERFKKIDCRTEIRMAQKSGVTTRVLSGVKEPEIVLTCEKLLRQLLRRKKVPFPPLFSQMLSDEKNWLMVAEKDGIIISFILLAPDNVPSSPLSNLKTSRLELMATNDDYKKLCPNYLLIWDAIAFLKKEGYEAMIWGFSHYLNSPDPGFDSVRAYKEKWHVESYEVAYDAPLGRYIYFRYLRRFNFVKKVVYWVKVYLLRQEI